MDIQFFDIVLVILFRNHIYQIVVNKKALILMIDVIFNKAVKAENINKKYICQQNMS